jgi:hypothetical protein
MHTRIRSRARSLCLYLTRSLGQALGVSRALQHLSVARNSICAPGATCFVNALYDGRFVALESLDLRQNDIGRYAARCGSFVWVCGCVGVWVWVCFRCSFCTSIASGVCTSSCVACSLATSCSCLALSLKRSLAHPLQPHLSVMDKDMIEFLVFGCMCGCVQDRLMCIRNRYRLLASAIKGFSHETLERQADVCMDDDEDLEELEEGLIQTRTASLCEVGGWSGSHLAEHGAAAAAAAACSGGEAASKPLWLHSMLAGDRVTTNGGSGRGMESHFVPLRPPQSDGGRRAKEGYGEAWSASAPQTRRPIKENAFDSIPPEVDAAGEESGGEAAEGVPSVLTVAL